MSSGKLTFLHEPNEKETPAFRKRRRSHPSEDAAPTPTGLADIVSVDPFAKTAMYRDCAAVLAQASQKRNGQSQLWNDYAILFATPVGTQSFCIQ
jgi:hypothetical protein